MTQPLLTAVDVAEYFRVSVDTIRRRVKEGSLKSIRLAPGGPLRFHPDDLPSGDNMSVFLRRDRDDWPYLDISYTDQSGGKRRKKIRCPSRSPRACAAFERQVRAEIANGRFREGKPMTLREFAPVLTRWLKTQKRKPAYIDTCRSTLKHHIVPYFGHRVLTTIRPSDIDAYKDAKDHLKPKTINNHLGVLSKLLHLAVRDGHLPAVLKIEGFSVEVHEAPFLTEHEANELVAACSGRLRTMVIVALDTGVRLGELLGLQWEDIDLEARTVRVCRQWCQRGKVFTEPKHGRHRTVPLTARAAGELGRHPRRLRCKLVFWTCSGKVVDKPDVDKALRRACGRAKLEPFGFHRCRHTFASWLVQRGVDLYHVQKLLGHATIKQTERYAHLSQQSLAEAVRRLD